MKNKKTVFSVALALAGLTLVAGLLLLIRKEGSPLNGGLKTTTQWASSDGKTHQVTMLKPNAPMDELLRLEPNLTVRHLIVDQVTVLELFHPRVAQRGLVFFLHEHGGSKENFLLEAIPYAQSGFYCVLMDMPGHGERGTEDAVESIESAVLSTIDLDLLLDYYRLSADVESSRFALVGISLGGSAAYHYAAFGSHSPVGLVIACTSPDFSLIPNMGSVRQGGENSPTWGDAEYRRYCLEQNPILRTERLTSIPLLSFNGMKDRAVTPQGAMQLQSLMKYNQNNHTEFFFDPDAGHAVPPWFMTKVLQFLISLMK